MIVTNEMLDAALATYAGLHGHEHDTAAMLDAIKAALAAADRALGLDYAGAASIAGTMPGTTGFTMAVFKADNVPVGTKVYAAPQPSAEPVAWIVCEERMPDDEQEVLVLVWPTVYIAEREKGEWWHLDAVGTLSGVTHWMPLPAPPADGGGR